MATLCQCNLRRIEVDVGAKRFEYIGAARLAGDGAAAVLGDLRPGGGGKPAALSMDSRCIR